MAFFKEPTQWGHPLGDNADTVTIPDNTGASTGLASLKKLFQPINQLPLSAGGIAPSRTDFNALFKLVGDSIYYAMNGGVPSYNADYDYIAGRVVRYTDNNLYKCIQANGPSSTVVAPTDAEYWLKFAFNNDLANYLPLAGGNITGNLTVQNKNVVRSVNGVNADKNGNVQLGNFGAITGKIEWFAFNTAPDGYLVCNGANVSRTTYADLFNAIGTTFGSGDGSTTFTLPNLIDKFAQGSTTVGTVKSAGLPNITGGFYDLITSLPDASPSTMGSADGAFYTRYLNGGDSNAIFSIPGKPATNIGARDGIGFNASRSSAIYGNSTTVQPPALTLLPCIRY